ncbi:MAG: MBOAT family protein [Oscillospiraceae bacterium]|nr:MBOAT family protein [Oscillospiraceae bacterium]
MLLNTITYMCFLAVTATIHYLLPVHYRNIFLLLVSIVFLWENGLVSLGIAVAAALITYLFGRKIASCEDKTSAKRWMLLGSALLVLNLCFFKFAHLVSSFFNNPISVLFPVGISFYSFASIGYLADIYNGKIEPEKGLVDWLLFVLFYPQVLSGPIARTRDLMPQIKSREVTEDLVSEGLRRLLTGAMCKIVLADGLGILVDGVYNHLDKHSGLAVTITMFLYTFQLYFDFSGYSSMAIGSGMLFGVRLHENFLAPFFSTGMGEIWRRWHITLSEWFRDYLYFPLGGSRKGERRTLVNLFIVFLVSALWHGNSWTNLIWGAVIVVSRFLERMLVKKAAPVTESNIGSTKNWLKRIGVFFWWLMTMLPFRLETVEDMVRVVTMQFQRPNLKAYAAEFLNLAAAEISNTGTYYLIYLGSIVFCFAVAVWMDWQIYRSSILDGKNCDTDPLKKVPFKWRWVLYWLIGLMVAAMYIITQTGGGPSFIYQGY